MWLKTLESYAATTSISPRVLALVAVNNFSLSPEADTQPRPRPLWGRVAFSKASLATIPSFSGRLGENTAFFSRSLSLRCLSYKEGFRVDSEPLSGFR